MKHVWTFSECFSPLNVESCHLNLSLRTPWFHSILGFHSITAQTLQHSPLLMHWLTLCWQDHWYRCAQVMLETEGKTGLHPISLLTRSKKARSPVSEPLSTDTFCVPSALCTVCLLFVHLCIYAWGLHSELSERDSFLLWVTALQRDYFFFFLASVPIRYINRNIAK